jgi:hypothetical protein
MSSNVIITGAREFSAAIEGMERRMNIAAYKVVVEGGKIITEAARREFTTPIFDKEGNAGYMTRNADGSRVKRSQMPKGFSTNTAYRGRHVGGTRPHTRTGTLEKSIETSDITQVGRGRWQSTTGPKADYGRRIELGFTGEDTKKRHYKQPPYPYLQPGFEKSRPALITMYEETWKAALHG